MHTFCSILRLDYSILFYYYFFPFFSFQNGLKFVFYESNTQSNICWFRILLSLTENRKKNKYGDSGRETGYSERTKKERREEQ